MIYLNIIANKSFRRLNFPKFLPQNQFGQQPVKGRVKEKNTSPGKRSFFFCLALACAPERPRFSPLFAPVISILLVTDQPLLIRTSHPSGSRISLCFKHGLKHSPWSNQSDPRKSSVPCRVQLDISQILWFLANPFKAHDIGKSG